MVQVEDHTVGLVDCSIGPTPGMAFRSCPLDHFRPRPFFVRNESDTENGRPFFPLCFTSTGERPDASRGRMALVQPSPVIPRGQRSRLRWLRTILGSRTARRRRNTSQLTLRYVSVFGSHTSVGWLFRRR